MTLGEAGRFGAKPALRMAQLSAMMAAAITLAAVLGITSAAASTLVETTNGWVQGKTVGSVDQWLGIRYAASPAGVGRWTPPKPPGSVWHAAGSLQRDAIWRSLSAEHLSVRQLDPASDTA